MDSTQASGGELTPLRLEESAALLGAYCALERGAFEAAGRLCTAVSGMALAVHLDGLSAEHAWHAELWADRLPVLASIDAQALIVLPPVASSVFDLVNEEATPSRGLAIFVRVVLPRLLSGYCRHRSLVSFAADGPTMRALRLVMRDEVEGWLIAESLLQGYLAEEDRLGTAAEASASAERLLAESGVGVGFVAWPARRG
jgi:hypothetical protein